MGYQDKDSIIVNVTSESNAEPVRCDEIDDLMATPSGMVVTYDVSKKDRILRLLAFIGMVFMTVMCSLLILPLVWMVPMTIRAWRIYWGDAPNTFTFDICVLLFVFLPSGILLLFSWREE